MCSSTSARQAPNPIPRASAAIKTRRRCVNGLAALRGRDFEDANGRTEQSTRLGLELFHQWASTEQTFIVSRLAVLGAETPIARGGHDEILNARLAKVIDPDVDDALSLGDVETLSIRNR